MVPVPAERETWGREIAGRVNGHEVLPSGGQQISPLAVPSGGHEKSPDRTFEVVPNHLLPVVFGESDGRADPFM